MMWKPHLYCSNLRPDAHRRLCHNWALCFTWTNNCHIVSFLLPPVMHVKSSTKPMMLNDMVMSPIRLYDVIPWAFWLWWSNNILEMKHHVMGELPNPWPVPWIRNFPQCWYDVFNTIDDLFNLYFASSKVAAWTYMILLCTPYFHLDKLATDINIRK